jgi:Smg protein
MQLIIEIGVDEQIDYAHLLSQFEEAGFTLKDIKQAIAWLQNFAHTAQRKIIEPAPPKTQRVFMLDEQQKLGRKGQNFLLYLQNIGVVNCHTREMIIERLMDLNTREITLAQIQWATLVVLSEKAVNLNELSWLTAVISHPESKEVCH